MIEREIYDRTVAFVSEQMHREFGPIHAMQTGQASALVGFAVTLIDAAIERYRVTRRRRPWCRVPWQKQSGRRVTQSDPIRAKSEHSLTRGHEVEEPQ